MEGSSVVVLIPSRPSTLEHLLTLVIGDRSSRVPTCSRVSFRLHQKTACSVAVGESECQTAPYAAKAVGGDSAGGLLAAVVCLICRDRNVNPPIAQVLIYPTDLAIDTPSWYELDFLHPNRSRENF